MGGRRAQAGGAVWEHEFDLRMSSAGIVVVRQYPAVAHLGEGLGLRVIGPGYVDRILLYNGRAAITDLKSTGNSGTASMKKKAGYGQTGHRQFQNMVEAAEVGVPSFYCLLWREHAEIGIHPITPISTWPFSARREEAIITYARDDEAWPFKLRDYLFNPNGKAQQHTA